MGSKWFDRLFFWFRKKCKMVLWKWLTYDVDLSKRRNKILTVFSILITATLIWLFLLPILTPCGTWLCTDTQNQNTDCVIIHENTQRIGYTVIIMSPKNKTLDASSKDSIITAWIWRYQTFQKYSFVQEITR